MTVSGPTPASYLLQTFLHVQTQKSTNSRMVASEQNQALPVSELEGALQGHLLKHVATSHLALLRSTCRAGRDLVDTAPVEPLLTATRKVLLAAVLAHIRSSLQEALRQQAKVLRRLRSQPSAFQALPSALLGLYSCYGWSPWTPSAGHQWLAGMWHEPDVALDADSTEATCGPVRRLRAPRLLPELVILNTKTGSPCSCQTISG